MPEYSGDQAVTLPNLFPSPGSAMQSYIIGNQRNTDSLLDWQYRRQREDEMNEWRKMNLIGDLTDLSKHQTGSDVANAIGDKQAAAILQKYTALAKTMSPSELQAKVHGEMRNTISGMDALKNEMNMSDEQLKMMKQQYPDLDYSSMLKDYRKEILNRRLAHDEKFVNPIEVTPSAFRIDDPEFLSNYVTGNKRISESITNPKGLDPTDVFVGNHNQYTKFSAKVPFWRKPNFSDEQMKDGFLKSKENPKLNFKTSTIPTESIPSSSGKPFEVVDSDVYKKFSDDAGTQLELIAAAKKSFPNYDKFNATEKEYAQRNELARMLKSLDQNDFHPTDVKANPKWIVNPSGSGGDKDASKINDLFKRVDEKATEWTTGKFAHNYLPVSYLDADAQAMVVDYARKLTGDNLIGHGDIKIIKKDGDVGIYYAKNDRLLGNLNAVGVNLKAQPGVKEKREVIKEGEHQSQPKKTYKYNGHEYTEEEVKKAAQDEGLSVEQYVQKFLK
jgi:ribosomal protein L32E